MSAAILLALAVLGTAPAQAAKPAPALFERLAGHRVMTGTIDGKSTTHDVDAETVLNKGYLRLHEVSREKDASGAPQYESNGGIATATPAGNTIPFLFRLNSGEIFHNTFIYDPASDAWRWELDGESNGARQPFARLALKRR